MLAEQPSAVAAHANEVVGLTAVTYGDRWTGTNLLEQAVQADPSSVSARFNLATGYATTNRLSEAAAIYRTLVNDGQFTWAVTRRDPRNANLPPRRLNIADESARRLAAIDSATIYAVAPNGRVFAATEAGVPAAAIVGAPIPASGRISDAEALRRDGIR